MNVTSSLSRIPDSHYLVVLCVFRVMFKYLSVEVRYSVTSVCPPRSQGVRSGRSVGNYDRIHAFWALLPLSIRSRVLLHN